jgi:2'-5' RNA ligase
MLVHCAIVPPRAELAAVAAVVRAVPEPAPAPAEEHATGLLGRLGRRRAEVAEVDAPPMLEHVPINGMQLPVTAFGNLTVQDAERLADAIGHAASEWSPPHVHFAGGTALDFPGDWSVWAKLAGDLDALGTVARGVTQAVEALGFFVDRRAFRPMLSVATVTPATTGPYLEQVVDALDGFRGEPWTADVVLLKETCVASSAEMVEFHRIALA